MSITVAGTTDTALYGNNAYLTGVYSPEGDTIRKQTIMK